MRLIDADELHKELEKKGRPIGYNEYKRFYYLIDDAPTVDQWHYPSRGEYPTEDASYFVTLEHLRGFKERFVSTASYYKEYGWGGFEPLFYRVVAWMPLPEPPKEEA